MYPKTFLIELHQPFKHLTSYQFSFYVHQDSEAAVLDWLDRVLPGLDTAAVREQREEAARPFGLAPDPEKLPIVIRDGDNVRQTEWVEGRLVTVPTPPGHFRLSQDETDESLQRIIFVLRELSLALTKKLERTSLGAAGRGPVWAQLYRKSLQKYIARALTWQTNLQAELLKSQGRISQGESGANLRAWFDKVGVTAAPSSQ